MHQRYLLLDSRDQKYFDTTTDDCFFEFRFGGLLNATSIELISFSLPLTLYNVNMFNNLIYFNDGADKIAEIPPGNYSATNLLIQLKTSLQAVSSLTFTPTYSDVSMKFTISASSAITLTFATNTVNSAANILGFTNNNLASNTSFTGQNVINLSIPLYINVIIDGFSSQVKSSNPYDNATFCISTMGNNGDILCWTSDSFYKQEVPCTTDNIQSLHVTLKGYGNTPLNFNGSNWSMLLKINYC